MWPTKKGILFTISIQLVHLFLRFQVTKFQSLNAWTTGKESHSSYNFVQFFSAANSMAKIAPINSATKAKLFPKLAAKLSHHKHNLRNQGWSVLLCYNLIQIVNSIQFKIIIMLHIFIYPIHPKIKLEET